MSLSYQQKLEELRVKSLSMNHFPVCDRSDRPNQVYVAKFSNGMDMGTFLSRQQKALREGRLAQNKEQLLKSFLKIEEEFVDSTLFIRKLVEAKEICEKCGYYPVPDNRKHKRKGAAKFQDKTDVGSFIKSCKMMLTDSSKLNKKERKLVEKFLVSEYSYKAYCLKQKVEAVKEASRELGCLPVPDRGYINQLKVRKFQDGTDMGSFINYHNYLYKNHQMDPNEESSWKEIFALKERLRKLEFIKRMKELFEIVSKTKSVPKYGYHFQDQTDIGNFISLYKRKIKKGDCTKLEEWLFHKFLILEEQINEGIFQNKVKESIKTIVDMECFPITSGPNKNQNLIRKFQDGKDIGSFIWHNIDDFHKNKLSLEKEKAVFELININLEEVKNWNRGYHQAKEYFDQYGSLDITCTNNLEVESPIHSFLVSNIVQYYSNNKSLLQEVHEDMLTDLDPNWTFYISTFKGNTLVFTKNKTINKK